MRTVPETLAAYGYATREYAHSFADFGDPLQLEESGGWVLRRQIPGTLHHDAMGLYPLFSCHNWEGLEADLSRLADECVALSLVTDPFGDYHPALLQRTFTTVCYPFKDHYIVDLSQPAHSYVAAHHRRNAGRARLNVEVEVVSEPLLHLDDWQRLYNRLIERHAVQGLRAFSRSSFEALLGLPETVMLRALAGNETVGMLLWMINGEVAHYHLGAYDARGYDLLASFALFWNAIDYFADRGLRWLNLGGGAGVHKGSMDGLSRFKRGWATGTRKTYFCGRILNPDLYQRITSERGMTSGDYFPVYRTGEFR